VAFHATYPASESLLLTWVAWLVEHGKLAGLINLYLASMKKVHASNGMTFPQICPDIIKDVLQGITNQHQLLRKAPKKVPITPKVLKLLKAKLFGLLPLQLSMGVFRMGELLCSTFGGGMDLPRKDVTVQKKKDKSA